MEKEATEEHLQVVQSRVLEGNQREITSDSHTLVRWTRKLWFAISVWWVRQTQ